MQETKYNIPLHKEINEFLVSINSEYRSKNPLFYCLPMQANFLKRLYNIIATKDVDTITFKKKLN